MVHMNSEEEAMRIFNENKGLAGSRTQAAFKKVSSVTHDIEDIYQEALTALWKAACSYDESKGVKFSTYAYKAIDGAIYRSRQATAYMVKMPEITMDLRHKRVEKANSGTNPWKDSILSRFVADHELNSHNTHSAEEEAMGEIMLEEIRALLNEEELEVLEALLEKQPLTSVNASWKKANKTLESMREKVSRYLGGE